MQVLSLHDTASALARASGKHVVYLEVHCWSFRHGSLLLDTSELFEAAPALKQNHQAAADGYAFVVCDSLEEMQRVYDSTVGDDGPTDANSYEGAAKVYALTVYPDGEFGNENT